MGLECFAARHKHAPGRTDVLACFGIKVALVLLVAAITLVDIGAFGCNTSQIRGLGENIPERMPIIGVVMQGIGMKHERAAGGRPVGGRDRGFAAERVRSLGLAFANRVRARFFDPKI